MAPEPFVHEEPVDTNPVPEPTKVAEDIPLPPPSDDVHVASPVKHDSPPPSKSVTKEGEIRQSEPSSQQQESPATSSVLDPLVTERTTTDKIETRVSPSMIIEKSTEQNGIEQSARAEKEFQVCVPEDQKAEAKQAEEEKAIVPPPVEAKNALKEN
jgi:hypothetical protein